MICNQVIGHINSYPIADRKIECLNLHWFETTKRIMRKRTESDQEIVIKILEAGCRLGQGDILYCDENRLISVNILACDAIQVRPRSLYEMGTICYEIGNKHLPLFIQDDHVLIPYEKPLERLLLVTGYEVSKVHCKLLNRLKASVEPHQHGRDRQSVFSKILDLTT